MNDRFKFRGYWNESKRPVDIQEFVVEDLSHKDQFIIHQCTGIKDVNGKLIFEQDIIKIRQIYPNQDKFNSETTNYVIWSSNYPRFELGQSLRGLSFGGHDFYYLIEKANKNLLDWYIELEVIGNIINNPELLTNNG